MKLIHSLLSLILIMSVCNKSQSKNPVDIESKIRALVLSENAIGQEFIFTKILEKDTLDYRLTLIGIIKNKRYGVLKIINVNTICGLKISPHSNGTVYLYDKTDKLVGSYYVGGSSSLPIGTDSCSLIFNEEGCDITTKINVADSIPEQIYIPCTQQGGDIWSFSYSEQ